MSSPTGEARAVQLQTAEGPVTVLGLEVLGTDGRFVVHRQYLKGGTFSTTAWVVTHTPTGLRAGSWMRERDNAARVGKRAFDLLTAELAPMDERLEEWRATHLASLSGIELDLAALAFELEPDDLDGLGAYADTCPDEEAP